MSEKKAPIEVPSASPGMNDGSKKPQSPVAREKHVFEELKVRMTELEQSYLAVKEENEVLSKRLSETHSLYKIAAMLNSTYDAQRLYPLIQHMLGEISFVEQFALMMSKPEAEIEVSLFTERTRAQDHQQLMDMERDIADHAIREQKQVFVTAAEMAQDLGHTAGGSILAIPLSVGPRKSNRCLCYYTPHEMTVQEVEFLNLISNEIAIALSRVDIYHETLEVSLKDELTGVYNRRYFNDRFNREIKRAERYGHPISGIMIDIDYFKKFNDTYGHHVGDEVLKGVAQQLGVGLRDCDVLARFGGEEFVIILPETNKEGAAIVAEKTRARISERMWEFRNALRSDTNPDEFIRKQITISLGITTFPEDGNDVNALMEIADQHLYMSKLNGRNRVSFTKKT